MDQGKYQRGLHEYVEDLHKAMELAQAVINRHEETISALLDGLDAWAGRVQALEMRANLLERAVIGHLDSDECHIGSHWAWNHYVEELRKDSRE